MTTDHAPENSLYAGLKKVFHEPSRMAIVTALCTTAQGLSFNDLKAQCALTDGNLNRHLKALTDVQAVTMVKYTPRFGRVRTMVHITGAGREQFMQYLQALEHVLRHTAGAITDETNASAPPGKTFF